MTFAGEDLGKVGRNEFVPAKEFQKRWIATYLKAFKNVREEEVGINNAVH